MSGKRVGRTGPRWDWSLLVLASIARTVLWVVAGLALWATLPLVLGWQPTTVMSDSMAPRIRTGDIVVTQPIHLPSTHGGTPAIGFSTAAGLSSLVPGRVLLVDDPDHPGRLRLHRYVRATATGQLILRGDANTADDSSPIRPTAVHGIAALRIPYAGLPITWARTGNRGALLAFALLALALLALTRLNPEHRPTSETHHDDNDDHDPRPPDLGPLEPLADLDSAASDAPSRGSAEVGGTLITSATPILTPQRCSPPDLSSRARPPRSRSPRRWVTLKRAVAAVLALTVSLTVVGSASAALSRTTADPGNTWAALPYYTCSSAVASDSPSLWWRFDEAAGATTAADSSGNNYPGTDTGGTTGTGGVTLGAARAFPRDTGSAATLNGATGYIGAGTGAVAIAGPNIFTIEVWFKTSVAGGKLVGFGGSATGQSGSNDRHCILFLRCPTPTCGP